MNRGIALLLAGCLVIGAAGPIAAHPPDERAARDLAARLDDWAAPVTPPPFSIYLPAIFRQFVAGYVSPFGIDMYAGNSDADGQAQMRSAGSGWETVVLQWSNIEPTAPISNVHIYNWSYYDGVAARAQAAGMGLFVLFNSNPAWASSLPDGPVPPANLAYLNAVAAAAAERYDGDSVNDAPGSPVINDWSYYAEPDRQTHWGNQPAAYADMLAGVSGAVHSANSHAVVMIGGLAYDAFPTFVQAFLGNVLDRLNTKPGGAAAYIEAMPFHYYPISTSVWPTIKEKAQEIRGILSAHGVGSLPLIVPEMGYWSDTVPLRPDLDSNEAKQARGLVQMFARGLSVGIKQMSWFAVFDNGSATEAHGLFRGADLNSPKPSLTAYTNMITELYGARYAGVFSGPGLEGYSFTTATGGPKLVVWAAKQASANVTIHLSCVRRVDYMGAVTTVADGNPTWDRDATAGQITLQVLQDQPIYVSDC